MVPVLPRTSLEAHGPVLPPRPSTMQVGDRILNGRIEAFSCKRAGEDKKMAKLLEQQYVDEIASSPLQLGTSPLGPLSDSSTRRLLIDLISTMNASFPDHDFSGLRPEQFTREPNVNLVVNSVNKHLAPLREAYNSTFLEELWQAIEEVIRLHECEIYSYIPDMEEDPFSEGHLWALNFFFFNRQLKRILYFTCIATSKYSPAAAEAVSDPESLDGLEDMDDVI
mmetsp:Transcript_4014/g.11764  ORF Transcript_4014/g.11764 Transcript_4014/m.11764 type:complete len:224 (-) Transcript_4014:412-1083(-)